MLSLLNELFCSPTPLKHLNGKQKGGDTTVTATMVMTQSSPALSCHIWNKTQRSPGGLDAPFDTCCSRHTGFLASPLTTPSTLLLQDLLQRSFLYPNCTSPSPTRLTPAPPSGLCSNVISCLSFLITRITACHYLIHYLWIASSL